MREKIRVVIERLGLLIPARWTNRLVRFPWVQKLLFALVDKEEAELLFQKAWARRFKEHPEVLGDYWRAYRDLDKILKFVDGGSRILDVGCGISTVLGLLPGRRVGVDPLAERYKSIYSYPEGIEIIAAPGERLPFPDASFDAVFCTNALDHMLSPAQALGEMRRVLVEGGRLVLTIEIFEVARERDPAHPHALSSGAVRDLVEGSGFSIESTTVSPWIGISRYLEGLRSSDEKETILISRKVPVTTAP